jgi:hypothetical protein
VVVRGIGYYLWTNLGVSINPKLVIYTQQGLDPSKVQRMLLEHSLRTVWLKNLAASQPREAYVNSRFARRRYYSTRRAASCAGSQQNTKVTNILRSAIEAYASSRFFCQMIENSDSTLIGLQGFQMLNPALGCQYVKSQSTERAG